MPASTVLAWQNDPDARAFVLYDGPEPVAYGEIWDDADESESELAHLVVDFRARGRGLGRALVRSLRPLAGFDSLIMRVHPDNEKARTCYGKAGFTELDAEQADEWNKGQPIPYIWFSAGKSSAG